MRSDPAAAAMRGSVVCRSKRTLARFAVRAKARVVWYRTTVIRSSRDRTLGDSDRRGRTRPADGPPQHRCADARVVLEIKRIDEDYFEQDGA